MKDKRLRAWVQNGALLLLTVSALLLLVQLPLVQNIRLSPRAIFSQNSEAGDQEESTPPAAIFPSINLMVTGNSEHGRCGQLCLSAGDDSLQAVIPLFQEALGSAAEGSPASDSELRDALNSPGLFLELTSEPLPLEVVAAWLGEEASFTQTVRAMALTTGTEDSADLFLLNGEGEASRYGTALPASAVQSICEGYLVNGGYFAYESGYNALYPYTVLTADAPVKPDVSAERPAGYSAYNLLSALGFNAHTFSRYTESGGAEVVEESPKTLRIGPDGVVSFTHRGEGAAGLYRVSGEGLAGAMAAGRRLAAALTDGTGASPLFLQEAEESENGCILRFRYQVDGTPVFFSGGNAALTIAFQNGAVTSFIYRCRAYTPLEEEAAPMLPTSMAQAVAAAYPDAALSIGYVDDGSERLSVQWRR